MQDEEWRIKIRDKGWRMKDEWLKTKDEEEQKDREDLKKKTAKVE